MSTFKNFQCKHCDKSYDKESSLVAHSKSHGLSSEDYYLSYRLNGVRPTCQCGCGEYTKYTGVNRGYKKYVSNEHYYDHMSREGREKRTREHPECNTVFEVKKSMTQRYCSSSCASTHLNSIDRATKVMQEKYGVDNYFATEEFQERLKKKNLEEHGVEFNGQIPDVKEKIHQTKIKKYGENMEGYDQVVEKIKQTKLERYGDENYCNAEQIIKTNQEKYGANAFTATEQGKQKILETVQERYGEQYTSTLQIPEIKKQIERTNLKKYGYAQSAKNPILKSKIRQSHYKTFYKKLLTSEKFTNKIQPLFEFREYAGVEDREIYPFKCVECGHEFQSHLDNGYVPRCDKCYPYFISMGESELIAFLREELGIENLVQNDRDMLGNGKELDVYLPDHKIAIEFDGVYWHSERCGKDKNYHKEKTDLCESRGIHLIHLFEDEWVFKQEIVKQRLKHILNKLDSNALYARNCTVQEITSATKNEFLERHHIQGKDRSKVKLGLFHDDVLVGVITFSKPRKPLGGDPSRNNVYELSRYVTSERVIGGASKLLKHFQSHFKPDEIYSYADRRWTNTKNNLYQSIGFRLDKITTPNYWYFKGSIHRIYRYNFRKSMLKNKLKVFNPELTEWENMQLNGYNRIWDCGHLKYIWKKEN